MLNREQLIEVLRHHNMVLITNHIMMSLLSGRDVVLIPFEYELMDQPDEDGNNSYPVFNWDGRYVGDDWSIRNENAVGYHNDSCVIACDLDRWNEMQVVDRF